MKLRVVVSACVTLAVFASAVPATKATSRG